MNADCIQKGYGPLYEAASSLCGGARLVTVDDNKVLCVQGKIFDEIAVCVDPFEFAVISHDMTETQRMDSTEGSKENDKVNYVSRSMKHLKLQADSCFAMANDCKRYDEDIGITTTCC